MNDHSDPVNNPWVGLKMRRKRETRTVTELTVRADGKVWRVVTIVLTAPGKHPCDREITWQGMQSLSQWSKWASGAEVVK